MNYCLLKLRFLTPVHFGSGENAQSLSSCSMSCCADTFYSALCHAALSGGGEERLNRLSEAVRTDGLRFSDLFPYCGNDLYLPRPMLAPAQRNEANPLQRKRLKNVKYISCSDMEAYFAYLRGEAGFEPEQQVFGSSETLEKAAIHENDDSEPYAVELFRFDNERGCGLYAIVGFKDAALRDEVIELTRLCGLSGLGGRISAGCGKFELTETVDLTGGKDASVTWLAEALADKESGCAILLSAALPQEHEFMQALEHSSYGVIRRAGFAGIRQGSFRKKKTQYFLSAGSVFEHRFNGGLFSVGSEGQPALRYGKAMFLGVSV